VTGGEIERDDTLSRKAGWLARVQSPPRTVPVRSSAAQTSACPVACCRDSVALTEQLNAFKIPGRDDHRRHACDQPRPPPRSPSTDL
jgi:hypothetical protein